MSKAEATRLADALDSITFVSGKSQTLDQAAALLRQWPDGGPVGPIYCVGNKVSHAYFWRRSDADAFAATAAPSIGLHVWEVQVMGKPPDSAAIDAARSKT